LIGAIRLGEEAPRVAKYAWLYDPNSRNLGFFAFEHVR
jgi:hypothetical protein